jgi:hypothetical protein
MIKIGTVGRITKGIYAGWYVFIEAHEGGSFTIFTSDTRDYRQATEGYDNWAQDLGSVEATLEHWGAEVDWLS